MTKYRRRLFVILSVAILVSFILDWLVFNPSVLNRIMQIRTVGFFLVVAGIAPLCFVSLLAKKFPHFAIGLAVLAVGILLNVACLVGYFVLNLNSSWLEELPRLSLIPMFFAQLIIIWEARRKSRVEKNVP